MVLPASSDHDLVPQVERIKSYRGLATVVNVPHRATRRGNPHTDLAPRAGDACPGLIACDTDGID